MVASAWILDTNKFTVLPLGTCLPAYLCLLAYALPACLPIAHAAAISSEAFFTRSLSLPACSDYILSLSWASCLVHMSWLRAL
jgi:xanthine/uracil/vitamin C permease (AzgA family)